VVEIRQLDTEEAQKSIRALAEVLVDCVEGGASVSFLAPFGMDEAEHFFEGVIRSMERGDRLLFAALDADRIIGTVQLVTGLPKNQPHRGEVAKLLVHSAARGQGVATRLMQELERTAAKLGRTLLTLDTVTGGAAETLYRRLGWTSAGVIPNYALFPDGTPCDTTIFWKDTSR
jgi:GNAT superfamily N-acetyltransferase